MVKGANHGKNQTSIRCEIQRRDLSGNIVGTVGKTGDLPGTSVASTDGESLAGEVSAGRTSCLAYSEGESSGSGNRKASCEDWSDDRSYGPFKKIPRDATTQEKRRYIRSHWKEFGSISRACKEVGLSSSSFYYQPKTNPDERAKKDAELRDRIEKIQLQYPMYGVPVSYTHLTLPTIYSV